MPVVRVGGGVGVGNGESERTCVKGWLLRHPGVGLEVNYSRAVFPRLTPVFCGIWKLIQMGPTHWAE